MNVVAWLCLLHADVMQVHTLECATGRPGWQPMPPGDSSLRSSGRVAASDTVIYMHATVPTGCE